MSFFSVRRRERKGLEASADGKSDANFALGAAWRERRPRMRR
jgi:hypothetical protein